MQGRSYAKSPKISRKNFRPTPASSAASPPTETTLAETPTDLATITVGSKTSPASEVQIRKWVNSGRLASYINPDKSAGRHTGRGRPVERWISVSELASFVAVIKAKSHIAVLKKLEVRDGIPPR